ncbi:MAG: DNA mismatch repair protein MutL [Candidatus Tokpelaia sp. JSC161]|jgi:DNA mismatch repair protein MutL|nr:MAG: DNA mismatch repair protein MutL [Candidatus Tokpelaia sp. JSC161]
MKIRKLSEALINQIAAGEVVDRPASVVKELIENAIDAEASRIEIFIEKGGKNLIRVSDNGCGIQENELSLAVLRHCTSKLGNNINDIRALGFRGEALPSIALVAHLRLLSRTLNSLTGAEISVSRDQIYGPQPAAANRGTVVEVRDLFYRTPARLKFMKPEQAETTAIIDTIRRIAIAFPWIHFSVSRMNRTFMNFTPLQGSHAQISRLIQVLGKEFSENTVELHAEHKGIRLTGFAGLPSYNRSNSLQQFFYVNRRPIRDKIIAAAIKTSYADAIARDRYGVVALFIEISPLDVDVNVHPAKTDIRFRNPDMIRTLIIKAIHEAFRRSGIRPEKKRTQAMLNAFQVPSKTDPVSHQSSLLRHINLTSLEKTDKIPIPSYPLGLAQAQIHQNYIIAQTQDGLVIVDQHAAHERLVYEALKKALYAKPLPSQILLIPEIVELPENHAERLLDYMETFRQFGLNLESFGPGAIAVRATPAILGTVNARALVHDLADEVAEYESTHELKAMLNYVAARMACHSSIRSGRILKIEEMNALLRKMEGTEASSTCNHGRPTYIELKITDIEHLFCRR